MRVSVTLAGKIKNEADLFKHQSALMAASMVYNAYIVSKDILIGTGPELYVEQWMQNYLRFSDEDFDDLIMVYFVKILQGVQNE